MTWKRGRAYGQDLRDRVLQATGRLCDVASRFGVSVSYVCRARARREQLGQTSPGAQRNHVPLRLDALKQEVLAQVALEPAQTLVQLCQWVYARHALVVKASTMHKSLRRFGLSYKKKRFTPASNAALTSRRPAPAGATNKPGTMAQTGWPGGG